MRWPIAAKLQLCFVVFLLLGPAATTVGKADALMPTETDKYFTRVITSIADLGITVTVHLILLPAVSTDIKYARNDCV